MTTIKNKPKELEKEENTIDNTLELIKYATEVQSRIKDDINSDYVLALLIDKDKEAIREMTNNAYLSKRMIINITKQKVWKWNKNKKEWEHKEIDEDTKKRIQEIANEVFDIHMIRHQMKVVLERNKKDNPILSGLIKQTATNPEEKENEEETVGTKLRNKFSKKEKEQQEQET